MEEKKMFDNVSPEWLARQIKHIRNISDRTKEQESFLKFLESEQSRRTA